MKICIALLCILSFNLASFSVQLAETRGTLQISTAQAASAQAASTSLGAEFSSGKSRVMAIFLALVCGLHQFYLENYLAGIVYVALTFLFGLGAVLSLLDCILLVTMTDQEFHRDVIAGETYWSFRFLMDFVFGS